MVHTPEEETNSEKELSDHLSRLKTLQISEPDKTEDQGILSSDVPEQFSDTNLRYKCIDLCAFKDKAFRVIVSDCVKLSKVLRPILYSIVF